MTYLTDCHTAFQGEDGISAHACSYLHNYSPIKDDPFLTAVCRADQAVSGLHCRSRAASHCVFLDNESMVPIAVGFGESRAEQVPPQQENCSTNVAKLIKGKPEYVLLDGAASGL